MHLSGWARTPGKACASTTDSIALYCMHVFLHWPHFCGLLKISPSSLGLLSHFRWQWQQVSWFLCNRGRGWSRTGVENNLRSAASTGGLAAAEASGRKMRTSDIYWWLLLYIVVVGCRIKCRAQRYLCCMQKSLSTFTKILLSRLR